MTRRKRILSVTAFLLGLVGAIACVGGIVGIWCVKARVRHVAENVFKKIDTSIDVVREHVSQTQDRITTLKTTTVALRQFVKNWSKKGAPGSDALWIEVTRRAERLESSVQIADKLLEISESSITWVHEALSMAGAAGSSQESTNVGELIEVLASLRSHLATARKLVLGIKEHSTTANNETPTLSSRSG